MASTTPEQLKEKLVRMLEDGTISSTHFNPNYDPGAVSMQVDLVRREVVMTRSFTHTDPMAKEVAIANLNKPEFLEKLRNDPIMLDKFMCYVNGLENDPQNTHSRARMFDKGLEGGVINYPK